MKVSQAVSAGIAALLIASATARADSFTITYEPAGVETSSVTTAGLLGTETFDGVATGSSGFTTNFGTSGAQTITGVYSAGADIRGPDIYGGAGGTGQYVDGIGGTSGYTVSLTSTGIPGVNYFGFWLSALDHGNQLAFYNGATLVGTYSPADMIAALGACPNTFCGNPNPQLAFNGADSAEPFAFVNFFDTTGYFDKIVFTEDPAVGNYESDNHTVGYCKVSTDGKDPCVTGTVVTGFVPEPLTISLFGAGLAGAVAVGRRRKKSA